MRTLICLGDSLTEAADIPVGHAWPSLVANGLGLAVVNRGIGGDTTAGMLARVYPEVVSAAPALVFIMGGTNDLWWGLEANTILANLFSIVFQARHHGIAPLIAIPPPVAAVLARQNDFSPPWDGYARFGEKMADLCQRMRAQATESEVPVVDLRSPFLTPDRKVRTDLYLPDGLHPDPAGQRIIADAAVDALRRHFNF